MTVMPGTTRANGTAMGLMYLICKFSNQTGNLIGTPGELLGWSLARTGPIMPGRTLMTVNSMRN